MKTSSSSYYYLLLAAAWSVANGYITSPGAVPIKLQQKWLRDMTTDICRSPPGELTDDMLQRAPDLMQAWSHAKMGGTEPALAVESLLVRLVEERRSGNAGAMATTTTDQYNCLLEGWARSRSGLAGAERCEQILEEMEERYRQGDRIIQPNKESFQTVLQAWKASDAPFAAVRAERVLEWMIQLATEGENERALPDADSFDIVLQLWSRSGSPQAPEKTEKLLGAMERLYRLTGCQSLQPRTTSFNAVLAAWCKSPKRGAMDRAMEVLQFMERQTQVVGEKMGTPDEASYTMAVSALMKSRTLKAAQTAETLLKKAELTCAPQAPDAILYNTVIGCWARCDKSGSYRKARSILDRQLGHFENGCYKSAPDVYGFTSVIASCAMETGGTEERTKAFHVALGAYQQLWRYDKPNHVTFGTMMKACALLLPEDDYLRHKWAKKIFKQSVKEGCVGDMVVSRLLEAVTPEVYQDLMQGRMKENLPEEWVRNVHEKSRDKKKLGKNQGRRAEV